MKVATFLFILLLSGCSLQKLALKSTVGLMQYGVEAIYSEPDLELAEQAIGSNLKLLEGFLQADPKNKQLLMLLTQGFASYSLGFVEDSSPERAGKFYLRARDYGFRYLRQTPAFRDSIPFKNDYFQKALQKLKQREIPAVFWTAFAWAGWINLNKDDPRAVYDLTRVKLMMNYVLKNDESFFFGSAHLFFGSVYGSLPKMLGGNPDKAKIEFEKSSKISNNKYLLVNVYYARYYAAATLNEQLFSEKLQAVLDASDHILPGYELITAIAKRKARLLLQKKEELF